MISVPGSRCRRDQRGEPFDHVLVECGPCVDAIGAHLVKQRVGEMIQRIGRLRCDLGRIGLGKIIHDRASMVAVLPVQSRKARRHAAHQACGRDIGQDAVVVDHQRRRKHVTKLPADGEVAVIAIP